MTANKRQASHIRLSTHYYIMTACNTYNTTYNHTTVPVTEVTSQNLSNEVSISHTLLKKPLVRREHSNTVNLSVAKSRGRQQLHTGSSCYSNCHMQPPSVTTQVLPHHPGTPPLKLPMLQLFVQPYADT